MRWKESSSARLTLAGPRQQYSSSMGRKGPSLLVVRAMRVLAVVATFPAHCGQMNCLPPLVGFPPPQGTVGVPARIGVVGWVGAVYPEPKMSSTVLTNLVATSSASWASRIVQLRLAYLYTAWFRRLWRSSSVSLQSSDRCPLLIASSILI